MTDKERIERLESSMIYKINNKRVTEEEFETELQKRIDDYVPYSQYYPKKEDIRKILIKDRQFIFNKYDKRYNKKLIITNQDVFIAVEKEILEISGIVEENEYDALDDDALRIAISLYENGYRKQSTIQNQKAVEALGKVKAHIMKDVDYKDELERRGDLSEYGKGGASRNIIIIAYIDQLISELGGKE